MTAPAEGPPDATSVLLPGPWTHRDISANGVRLHAAELGEGPLVLLLHGFPQFWWTWRAQLVSLSGAGFRVVAPDLRGYGASDKPPRGYDAPTLAADAAALIGIKSMKKVEPPPRTIRTIKDTAEWARHPTIAPDVRQDTLAGG